MSFVGARQLEITSSRAAAGKVGAGDFLQAVEDLRGSKSRWQFKIFDVDLVRLAEGIQDAQVANDQPKREYTLKSVKSFRTSGLRPAAMRRMKAMATTSVAA